MKVPFAGLRILCFVAAMLVAVMDITQAISINITGRGEDVYWGAGTAGVDILLVISGFAAVVVTAGVPAMDRGRVGAAWAYLKRRVAQIVPVYWVYTLLKAALVLAVPALAVKSVITPGHLAASLFFVPVTAPWGLVQPVLPAGWMLEFEMLFCGVFACALALGAPRLRMCLLVFLSIVVASRFAPGSVALAFFAQSIVFEFILGIAMAMIVLRWGTGPVGAGALLLAVGAVFTFGMGWDPNAARLFPWGAGAAAIVLGTLWLEPVIADKRWARPLAFLGDASYSIYLSHTFVVPATVVLLKKLGMADTLAVFTIAALAVMAAGSISYLWLEKPLTAAGLRLLFRRPAPLAYPHAANTASE